MLLKSLHEASLGILVVVAYLGFAGFTAIMLCLRRKWYSPEMEWEWLRCNELDQEYHKPSVRVLPVHIEDQSDLLGSMLVRVVVGTSGAVAQGLDRAAITVFLAVDILSVGPVFDGGVGVTPYLSA